MSYVTRTFGLTSFALAALCAASALGQTAIQAPTIQGVNINTTIQAPAGTLQPPPAFIVREPSRAFTMASREYEQQIRRIRARYLGHKRYQPGRERGLRELEQFTQKAAIEPLIEILRKEDEDVKQWLFDHLKTRLDHAVGHPVLTYLSIYDEEEEFRDRAREALEGPVDPLSRHIVEYALQSRNHDFINAGAMAAGHMRLVDTIPLLIQAQAGVATRADSDGDLAWILIGTQRAIVTDLQPVVGENSAGLDPTLSPLTEGTIVVIQDAIVTFARWPVHNALVGLVEDDFGRPVDFGFDTEKWQEWYAQVYLPYKAGESTTPGVEAQSESSDG